MPTRERGHDQSVPPSTFDHRQLIWLFRALAIELAYPPKASPEAGPSAKAEQIRPYNCSVEPKTFGHLASTAPVTVIKDATLPRRAEFIRPYGRPVREQARSYESARGEPRFFFDHPRIHGGVGGSSLGSSVALRKASLRA